MGCRCRRGVDPTPNLLAVDTIVYLWKSQEDLPEDDPTKHFKYYGVKADQVATLFPELVYDEQTPYQLNYSELIPVLINAIRELKAEKDQLKAEKDTEVAELRAAIAELKA